MTDTDAQRREKNRLACAAYRAKNKDKYAAYRAKKRKERLKQKGKIPKQDEFHQVHDF